MQPEILPDSGPPAAVAGVDAGFTDVRAPDHEFTHPHLRLVVGSQTQVAFDETVRAEQLIL